MAELHCGGSAVFWVRAVGLSRLVFDPCLERYCQHLAANCEFSASARLWPTGAWLDKQGVFFDAIAQCVA
jgi:hypothetical protein